jgi:hypothetical protein
MRVRREDFPNGLEEFMAIIEVINGFVQMTDMELVNIAFLQDFTVLIGISQEPMKCS